jgi:hypothetical protein
MAEPVTIEDLGRCQCSGQCGHTHAWTEAAKKQTCDAPHGCAIVRKTDYPSFWQLAATDAIPLEHAEHYAADKPILVELEVTTAKDGKALLACQRCKLLIEEEAGTGKKRRGGAKAAKSADGGA